jgi:type IV pilus assembly protein PilM
LDRVSEVSSTEKLLKLIRDKDGAPAPATPGGSPTPDVDHPKIPSSQLISLRKSSTVGIDIGHSYLRLVRAVEDSGGKLQVVDRRRLQLPAGTTRDAPEFSAFLKSALTEFCASAKNSELWAIMSTAHVELSHIRIPRVDKKQIANAVYWTAKRESPFNESEVYFDFDVQREVIEQGIPKIAVLFYTAPRQEVDDLRDLFSGIGWPLTGISIVPFAVQNYFRTGWITAGEGSLAHLFIGNDFSRIDVYSDGNLVMTRGIKAGNTSMVEALVEQYNNLKSPEAAPLTLEEGRKIFFSLSPDSPPLLETDTGFDLAKEKVFEMVQPALERLVRQVERTFEHFATIPGNVRIDRIFVTGAMNVYPPIIDYVGNQLGIESEVLDPLSERDLIPVCPDVDDAHCLSERIAFGPALGMALSDNDYTPNLLFSYKDKERAAGLARFNRMVLTVFVVLAVICTGIFAYQSFTVYQKTKALEGIEKQIADLGPPIQRDQLTKMAAKVREQRQLFRGYAEQYLDMVLLSELATLTPRNIRFIDLKMSLVAEPAGQGAKDAKGKKDAKEKIEGVTVEGLIVGQRQTMETNLAGYMRDLNASPIFHQITLEKNEVIPYQRKQEALHFILNLKVEGQVHG